MGFGITGSRFKIGDSYGGTFAESIEVIKKEAAGTKVKTLENGDEKTIYFDKDGNRIATSIASNNGGSSCITANAAQFIFDASGKPIKIMDHSAGVIFVDKNRNGIIDDGEVSGYSDQSCNDNFVINNNKFLYM